jgi:hypothetical protein
LQLEALAHIRIQREIDGQLPRELCRSQHRSRSFGGSTESSIRMPLSDD